jgi:hypothetical protein
MTYKDWFGVLLTPAIYIAVLYFCRDIFRSWVEKSIGQKFDVKLENLKADLRLKEQAIASELQKKEAEISALRNGILTGVSNRHIELDKRRLLAAEAIWRSVVGLRTGLVVLNLMSRINIEVAIKETKRHPKAREFFEAIGKSSTLDFTNITAAYEQPFVSPKVWEIFSIYQGIILGPYTLLQALRNGVANETWDDKELIKSVKLLLPAYSELLDKFGSSALRHVLADVEQMLLAEIRKMLNSNESDDLAAIQSIKVLESIEFLNKQRALEVQIPASMLRSDS